MNLKSKRIIREIKESLIFIIGFVFVFGLSCYFFYNTSLRDDFELRIINLKAKISQKIAVYPNPFTIIKIDDQSLLALKGDPNSNLNYRDLITTTTQLLEYFPSSITVVINTQVFLPDDFYRDRFLELLKSHNNLNIITLDNPYEDISEDIRSQVWSGDIYPRIQNKTHNILEVPLEHTNHNHLRFASYELAKRFNKNIGSIPLEDMVSSFKKGIKYFQPNLKLYKSNQYSLIDVLKLKKNSNIITDKDIIVGYTSYRPYTFRFNRATKINTVVQPLFGSLEEGMPLVELYAQSASALVNQKWIISANWLVYSIVLLCFVFAIFVFWIIFDFFWILILSSLILSFLFMVSVYLYAFKSIQLPLIDCVYWGVGLSYFFGYFKFKNKQKHFLKNREYIVAVSKVYELQNNFVYAMTSNIADLNNEISHDVEGISVNNNDLKLKVEREVKAASEILNSYINSFLKLLQIESNFHKNNVSYESKQIDLNQLVDTLIQNFAHKISEKEIAIKNNIPKYFMMHLNLEIVSHILLNILANAIKYVDIRGMIIISTRKADGKIQICIWNNGPIIPDDQQELIFAKFYRIKDENVYKNSGTGLGLYLSKYFSELIDAHIYVRSSIDFGTVFVVEINDIDA